MTRTDQNRLNDRKIRSLIKPGGPAAVAHPAGFIHGTGMVVVRPDSAQAIGAGPKTYLGLNIGYAIARGGEFLCWKAPKPHRVLYLVGEMAGPVMQQRVASIIAGIEDDPPDLDYFRLITPDANREQGMFDLSDVDDQQFIKKHTDWADVIQVDNISTLCRTGAESFRGLDDGTDVAVKDASRRQDCDSLSPRRQER